MRVALATFGVEEFALLHATCLEAGHIPVAYVNCRSMAPNSSTDADGAAAVSRIVKALPPGMDLLLPGTAEGLVAGLASPVSHASSSTPLCFQPSRGSSLVKWK